PPDLISHRRPYTTLFRSGYTAEGIQGLYEALKGLGELTVVAPETNCSASSNALTLNRPLSVRQAANGFYFVNGTPSDCVHIALRSEEHTSELQSRFCLVC